VSDLNLRKASYNTALNATVVLAPEDLEGAVVAPVVVPGVGDQPVRGSLLSYYYHVMITSFIIIFHF